MEVRFEVTQVYWVDDSHATMDIEVQFGDEWVSINHVEVDQKPSHRAYGVYVPRRRGGNTSQPAVFLSDDLYTGLRRAAIDAFKAGKS